MGLIKIISLIIISWFLVKFFKLVTGIKISSSNKKHMKNKNKIYSDVQDAEYEDIE